MTSSQRIRSPDGRFPAIPLGMAVADGMAMVHNFQRSDGWLQSLPADNIEPCSCSMFARSVYYREKKRLVLDAHYRVLGQASHPAKEQLRVALDELRSASDIGVHALNETVV
jgi:hypothetical protein